MAATAPAPGEAITSSDDLAHVFCCDPDTALCGTDVRGQAVVSEDVATTCIVCADLEDRPCPTCGN